MINGFTLWPMSLVPLVDDGSAAHTPDAAPWTFDEASRQWTQGIVPEELLKLRAQLASARAELAKYRAKPATAKLGIPTRALAFTRQDIGLRVPF